MKKDYNKPQFKRPPLEISFYCDVTTTEKEAFWHFIKALLSIQAKLTGQARIHRMQADGRKTFDDVTFNPDILDDLFAASENDPVHISMTNALGLVRRGKIETVRLNNISQKAIDLGDHRAFTILGDIDLLNRKTIPQLLKRFLQIVEVVRPEYACFCFIDYLECPVDLEKGSSEFHDFYISRRAVGGENYRRLLEGYEGAYRQEFEHGVYISTTTMNPIHMSLHNPFQLRHIISQNIDVGQLIHRRWMNRKLYSTD